MTAEPIATPVPAEVVLERVAAVRERIAAAGGDPERVRILAVTKGFGAWAPAVAASIGLSDLGENYAQELLAKALEVDLESGQQVRWHAIGRLQRNKVKALAPVVSCWQSIDRPSLADEVAKRAAGASVLVQVNVSDEEQKGGVAPAEAAALVERCRAGGLQVDGLMAVGAAGGPDAARPGFALLRRLADELQLPERSMGMTADLEAAVAEGATQVRVGTALFGARAPR